MNWGNHTTLLLRLVLESKHKAVSTQAHVHCVLSYAKRDGLLHIVQHAQGAAETPRSQLIIEFATLPTNYSPCY